MTGRASLAKLATMSVAQKRTEWRRLTGVPAPPAFGAGLLTRAIAHAMQEQAAGGPDKALARRLRQLTGKKVNSGSKAELAALKPGTWLSRTWHGEVHQVIVLESGFEYQGNRYDSLSRIARRITGAGWSGPRFFGLRSPRLGKLSVSHDG
jgi:hypothetical protein